MPDGSSSDAPVMSPGPSFEKNARTRPLYSSAKVHHQAKQKQDEEHDEQDLGQAGKCDRNASEAQESRYKRDDEKDQGVIKHYESPHAGVVQVNCQWRAWRLIRKQNGLSGLLKKGGL